MLQTRTDYAYGAPRLPNREEKTTVLQSTNFSLDILLKYIQEYNYRRNLNFEKEMWIRASRCLRESFSSASEAIYSVTCINSTGANTVVQFIHCNLFIVIILHTKVTKAHQFSGTVERFKY